jgi:hypothetical protein
MDPIRGPPTAGGVEAAAAPPPRNANGSTSTNDSAAGLGTGDGQGRRKRARDSRSIVCPYQRCSCPVGADLLAVDRLLPPPPLRLLRLPVQLLLLLLRVAMHLTSTPWRTSISSSTPGTKSEPSTRRRIRSRNCQALPPPRLLQRAVPLRITIMRLRKCARMVVGSVGRRPPRTLRPRRRRRSRSVKTTTTAAKHPTERMVPLLHHLEALPGFRPMGPKQQRDGKSALSWRRRRRR